MTPNPPIVPEQRGFGEMACNDASKNMPIPHVAGMTYEPFTFFASAVFDAMKPLHYGKWVRREDYEALQIRLAEVEKERDNAREALGGFGDPRGPFGGDVANGIRAISMRCAAAEKARDHAEVMKYPVENDKICELEADLSATVKAREEMAGRLADSLAIIRKAGWWMTGVHTCRTGDMDVGDQIRLLDLLQPKALLSGDGVKS